MTYANENLAGLLSILKVSRPHDTKAEKDFCARLYRQLDSLGAKPDVDGFGNIWARVNLAANVPGLLFSCHVDTMDSGQEEKGLSVSSAGLITLKKRKPGRCLGADDGAGLWLMLEMIRAGVPGLYAFHRGEERGRLGSSYVASHEPGRLANIDAAIAFDRRGTNNLITHQMARRGCSDNFAKALCKAVNLAGNGGLAYSPDDSGSYTDTYSYFDIVPECCNMSIGYQSEHGPNESLDFAHLSKLRAAIVSAPFSGLPIERDPSIEEYDDYFGGYGGWSWELNKYSNTNEETLEMLCGEYPETAASILESLGVTVSDFLEDLNREYSPSGSYNYRLPMR
jgi:hypothetical protein